MEEQHEHELDNKSFGGEDRFFDSFTLEDRIRSWISYIESLGGPIPNKVLITPSKKCNTYILKRFNQS